MAFAHDLVCRYLAGFPRGRDNLDGSTSQTGERVSTFDRDFQETILDRSAELGSLDFERGMKMDTDFSLSLSYHESGHAVALYVQGFAVKHITIIPDGSSEGRTEPIFDDSERENNPADFTRRLLMCEFCSTVAQTRFDELATPEKDFSDPQYSQNLLAMAGNDRKAAIELLECLRELGHNPEECANTALQQAQALVLDHWLEIESVAKTLLAVKSLNRGDIELILRPFGIVK